MLHLRSCPEDVPDEPKTQMKTVTRHGAHEPRPQRQSPPGARRAEATRGGHRRSSCKIDVNGVIPCIMLAL